jgi:hypothetical protein
MRTNNKHVLGQTYVSALEDEIKTLKLNNSLLLQELKDNEIPTKDWYKEIILFLSFVAFAEFCAIVALYFK